MIIVFPLPEAKDRLREPDAEIKEITADMSATLEKLSTLVKLDRCKHGDYLVFSRRIRLLSELLVELVNEIGVQEQRICIMQEVPRDSAEKIS
jgi:hypothetical protein